MSPLLVLLLCFSIWCLIPSDAWHEYNYRNCTDDDVIDAAEFAVSLWNNDTVSKWEFYQTLNDDDPVLANKGQTKKTKKMKNGKGKKAGKGKKNVSGNSEPPVFYTSFEVVEASETADFGSSKSLHAYVNYKLMVGIFNETECVGGLNVTVHNYFAWGMSIVDWGDTVPGGGLATISCDIIEAKVNTCNQPLT